jgi:hypothetical protein
VTDDEKIPPSDDNENENPFENFINKDLGMENVLPDAKPTSDNKSVASSKGAFEDDDFESGDDGDADDDSFSSTSRFGRLGSAPRPSNPFSSSGLGSSRFGGSSSGYNSPFGRSNPNVPPNSSFGGLGASGSFGSRFSAPPKFPAPPVRKTFSQRLWANLRAFGLEAWVLILMSLVALLVVLSTMLYIDNLRLQIAVGEGQITELRYQVQQLEDRLANTATP